MRTANTEQMQGLKEEEFKTRARQEAEKSRVETEKINKAFQERQQELEKNIPEQELQEEKEFDKVNRIFNKVANEETPTEEEINYVNEKSYLPKGFKFGKTGLEKTQEQPGVVSEAKPSEKAVSVPLLITKDMKQQISDLGYTKEDISSMKPEQAQNIINNTIVKPKQEETTDEGKIRERGAVQEVVQETEKTGGERPGRISGINRPEEVRQKKVPEVSSERPKVISFEDFGELKTGKIIEEGKYYVKVKDNKGIIHTIKPSDKRYKNVKIEGIPFTQKKEIEAGTFFVGNKKLPIKEFKKQKG